MKKSTNKSLKVGFIIDDGMDKPDGVQQYVLTLGGWLKKQGHEVRYLTGQTTRTDIKGLLPLSKNLKVRFNGNTLSTPLPASKTEIKRVLLKEKFDILHVQMPYSPFLAGRVVRFADDKTKIIATFHVLPVGKLQYFGNKLLAKTLRFSLKKFDKFLSVSAPAQKFAKQVYGIDSQVLPNPVDLSKFKSEGKKDDGVINIVFLGRLVPRKGCMELLKAVNNLVEENGPSNIKLHICGDGTERKKLEDFINSTKLKNITTMHGFVSEKDKVKFLNLADFAVFPALSGESFGIVLIEAMAANAGVVLAGNNPGYSSVLAGLEDCLFDPKNPIELSDKLDKLIKNKTLASKIHAEQQELVKAFDVDIIGSKLLEIYLD